MAENLQEIITEIASIRDDWAVKRDALALCLEEAQAAKDALLDGSASLRKATVDIYKDGMRTILNPISARKRLAGVGSLLITLPDLGDYPKTTGGLTKYTSTMMIFELMVFRYLGTANKNASFKLLLGGYTYASGKWVNQISSLQGNNDQYNDIRVRYGKRVSSGIPCILVETVENQYFSNSAASIVNLQLTHGNIYKEGWDDGWSISMATDLSDIELQADQPPLITKPI